MNETSLAQPGEMTIEQICEAIPASKNSVRQALAALSIKGRIPLQDRRYVFYPPGTKDKVKTWLEERSQH